jgi:tricorn protease interacting factor F2/3
MDKLDLIGIPNFGAGAMENFGLITFRESGLFCDHGTELNKKQEICQVICHEIAHQWFGNIVTMDWWKYLWLNESMATYFQWHVTNVLFPDWNIFDKFIDDEFKHALSLDSLETSHPIEVDVDSVKDLNQIFDGISYSKGSCLIRFLFNYLKEDNFRNGMVDYIRTYAYQNTTSEHLWKAFNRVTGKNISELMNSWIKQTGYPVVEISSKNNLILFTQNKFLKSGPNTYNTLWLIPLNVYVDTFDYNLEMNSKTLLSEFRSNNFIVVNPDRIGFYRVNYDIITFDINVMSSKIQKNIFDDMFALALSGYCSLTKVFKLFRELDFKKEFYNYNYNLLNTILTNLTLIYKLLDVNPELQSSFKLFIEKNILSHLLRTMIVLGWNVRVNDTNDILNFRPLVINFLGLLENTNTINTALERFNENKFKYNLQIVGDNASELEYKKMKQLLNSNDPHIRDEIVKALGNVKNKILIDDVINNTLFDKLEKQDIWITMKSLSMNTNKYAKSQLFKFVKYNWEKILQMYKPGSHELSSVIKAISSGMNTQLELDEFIEFFKSPPQGTQMTVNQSIEYIKSKLLSIHRITNDRELVELFYL